jgi:hypothetical protein
MTRPFPTLGGSALVALALTPPYKSGPDFVFTQTGRSHNPPSPRAADS